MLEVRLVGKAEFYYPHGKQNDVICILNENSFDVCAHYRLLSARDDNANIPECILYKHCIGPMNI